MRALGLFFSLFFLGFASFVFAQDTCPAIISAALEAVETACSATARNQLCYGNITLNATPRAGVTNFRFQQAGDVVGVADVETLQLSSFSLADEAWGVALMKLQANLPETLPGQNVTFLLFGDVQMRDAGGQNVEVPVTATTGVNVRLRPSTSASVLASLKSGQEITAIGRLADSTWIQVRLDGTTAGWAAADYLQGEFGRLLVTEPGAPYFGPMQAFYFTTGREDAPCEAAPSSGILVQTPEGAGTIYLRANNVDIRLGSTVYLQAVPGDALYVTVIEGHATLSAHGETQIVPAGTVATVPLDENGLAAGPPEYPQPYAFDRLQNLPVNSSLLVAVEVEQALAEGNIDETVLEIAGFEEITPQQTTPGAASGGSGADSAAAGSGQWIQNEVVTFNTCPGPLSVGDTNSWYPILVFSGDRQTFTYNGGPNMTTVTLGRVGDNVYQGVFGEEILTFTFTSPTSYLFSWVGVHGDPDNGGCRFVMEASAALVSGSSR